MATRAYILVALLACPIALGNPNVLFQTPARHADRSPCGCCARDRICDCGCTPAGPTESAPRGPSFCRCDNLPPALPTSAAQRVDAPRAMAIALTPVGRLAAEQPSQTLEPLPIRCRPPPQAAYLRTFVLII